MTMVCGFGLPLAAQPKGAGMADPIDWIFLIALGVFFGAMFLCIAFVFLSLVRAWVQAALSGAPVMFFDVIAMRLRRCPVQKLVEARVRSRKAGMEIPLDKWEAHFLARGKVEVVLEALIRAHQGPLTLDEFIIGEPTPGVGKEILAFNALASHNLIGGNPVAVVDAMIALRERGMAVTFQEAVSLDLAQRTSAGKQMVEAVAEAVERRRLESKQTAPQAQGEANA